jgi:hypothetical protein
MMRLAWRVACMGRKCVHGFGGGNMKRRGYLEGLGLHKRIILKKIIKK